MKKLFSFVCALVCAISLSARDLYLVPNSNWLQSSARFAVYAFGDGEAWVDMVAVDGATNTYKATIDDKYPKVIFCRMNPNTIDNNWDNNNKWNQTGDLVLANAGANNCYTINEGSWDTGTWSVFTDAPATLDYFALHGNFSGEWKTTPFTFSEDGATATLTMTLAAKEYEFGARIGSSNNWSASGETITRENNTANFTKSGGNNKLTADMAGTYTFTYTVATKVLTVTYPTTEQKYTLTFGVIGANGTLTATSGETAISSGDQVASATLTATPDEGYQVEGWYSNAAGDKALEVSGNSFEIVLTQDTSIYVKFMAEVVTPKDTVFFVNAADWTGTISCHAWNEGGNNNGGWPGVEMTKATYQLKDKDVYYYETAQGAYAQCIFNNKKNNDGGQQTGNLTWTSGKYYYNGAWFTREELESDEPIGDIITYGIGSNKNGYTPSNDPMTVSEDKATATCTIELTKDDEFQFSVVKTTNGSDAWLKNIEKTITRQENSAELGEIAGNTDNTVMQVDATGIYTFTFTIATSTITVTYPSQTGLFETAATAAYEKVIRNGQVLIIREGNTFNMLGQQVQ